MNVKRVLLYYSIAIISLTSACKKAAELYIGLSMQPKNVSSEFVPGLNVFGILKVGPSYDTLNHFFEVHQLYKPTDTDFDINVNEANIYLEQTINDSIKYYQLTNYNEGQYMNNELNPDFGEYWEYECDYDTFLVSGQTWIPNEPAIQQGSFITSDNNLSFTILPDSTAFLYEIFYISESNYRFERVIPVEDDPTQVDIMIDLKNDTGSRNLFVFAYDENYERYVSTSNTFFKPNAYRPRFTTVDGGYGCFCSAASIKLEF